MTLNYAIGFDLQKSETIESIFRDYKIDQIHVHQFDCIPAIFPACVSEKKPYVAFVHTGIEGIYNWFEEQYFDYKGMFSVFFEMASKIVCITEKAMEENKRKYNIPDDKYIIINNSIKFSEDIIKNDKIPNTISNFLILGRMGEEKRISIINAINIFKEYLLRHPEARLTIVGDGSIKDDIIKEVQNIKEKVTFLGTRTDVFNILLQNDIVIGLDRCILETIVSKRIAIVSGYSEIKGMVTPENINDFAKENFSGKELASRSIEYVVNEIEKLDLEKIKQITEQNYRFAYDNLNLDRNIYIFEGNSDEYKLEVEKYLQLENYLTNRMTKLKNEKDSIFDEKVSIYKEKESIYNEMQKQREGYEQQIKNIKQETDDKINNFNIKIGQLQEELNKYKDLYEVEKLENEKIGTKIRRKIYKTYRSVLNSFNKTDKK